MFRLAVLLSLIAFCAVKTQADHCCSAEDRHRVEEQWKELWKDTESSKIKITFGRSLLLKVAELMPEVKTLFAGVDIDHPEGAEFSAHSFRILNAIDMAINLLDDADSLDEALDHLAEQHRVREGVKKAHFKTFGERFLRALSRILEDFDSMSWKACFTGIIDKVAAKLQA